MITQGKLIIVTALACESRALIDAYALKRHHELHCYNFYSNKSASIFLIESGKGKIASAAAAAFAFQASGTRKYTHFVNIGIAGGDYPLNQLIQAHKITDTDTRQNFYPRIWGDIPSCHLSTVNTPQTTYAKQLCYDMESSGFYQAAARFVAHEQISVLKVISDNTDNEHTQITSNSCKQSILSNITWIKNHCDRLLELSAEEYAQIHIPYVEDILLTTHFSEYQKRELKQLCRTWHGLSPTKNLIESIPVYESAKELLCLLKENLDSLTIKEI
jgi:nucleoside phosphorylase